MTTSAEIRKLARRNFTPEMAKRGFGASKRRVCYFRKVNDIYHLIFLCFGRGHEDLFLHICGWVPELAPQPFDWNKFPDDVFAATGGILGEKGPVQYASGQCHWKLGTEEANLEVLQFALSLIDRAAIPWFDQIANRDDLAKHVNKSSESDRFGNKTVDKIFGKNLLYKDNLPPPIGAKA